MRGALGNPRHGRMLCLLLALLLAMAGSAAAEGALDLSGRAFESFDALCAAIDAAEDHAEVDLTGVALTVEERKALLARYPARHLRWTVDVWGKTISSEDTDVSFEKKQVGKISDLCDALDCLPNIKNVNMWDAQLKKEQRETLFSRYPDVFFGMTLQLNQRHTVRTDATAFSTLGKKPYLYAHNMGNFAHCPNLLALDVGHNTIMNLDFLYNCSKLKILIAADANISDITPIACQTDLEYVELFINKITDISPLAKLTNLRDVNLCFNDISDLSPLYDLPHLERVWLMMNKRITQEEIDKLREHQPNCQIVTRCYGSTGNIMRDDGSLIPGTSWRHHKHYDTIYYIFNGGGYVDWDVEVPSRASYLP